MSDTDSQNGLKRYQMYINGEWVDASSGKTFESVNPSNGQAWAEVPEASAADVTAPYRRLIKPLPKVRGAR